MSPSILSTYKVPTELKQEFYVDKMVQLHDYTALRCVSEDSNQNPVSFYLFMAGGDDETAPFLHIMTFRPSCLDATETVQEVNPVYPFNAPDMPEKVQGLINMAEQWLVHQDCN